MISYNKYNRHERSRKELAEEKKAIKEEKEIEIEIEPEPFVSGCDTNCCHGAEIYKPVNGLMTTFMIVERIFGCTESKIKNAYNNCNIPLTIKNKPFKPYEIDQEVCIKSVSFEFDCIGFPAKQVPIATNPYPTTYVDSIEVDVNVDGLPICTKAPNGSGTSDLYNKLSFALPKQFTCDSHYRSNGVEVTIIEQKAEMLINGFKLVVTGTIGDNPEPFIAESTIENASYSLVSLGINPMDFFAKLCVPAGTADVKVNEEFTFEKFNVSDVTPISRLKSTGLGGVLFFNANALICYSVNKLIYSVIKDKLAVAIDSSNQFICKPFNPCKDDCK